MGPVSVMIVDDHQIIVDGLKALLQDREGIQIAGEASNGQEALKLLSLISEDVVLLEIDMLVQSGIETTRELNVLKRIAQGYSNKEIGELLYISHRTVDTHRTNILKKLDVKNIAGLIRIAIQNGLVL